MNREKGKDGISEVGKHYEEAWQQIAGGKEENKQMKAHEDIYMWNTIKSVTSCSDEVREKIYDQLFGRTWTVDEVEQLEKEFINEGIKFI